MIYHNIDCITSHRFYAYTDVTAFWYMQSSFVLNGIYLYMCICSLLISNKYKLINKMKEYCNTVLT